MSISGIYQLVKKIYIYKHRACINLHLKTQQATENTDKS